VVIVVSEVIGYHSLLMNSMTLHSREPRGVERHSSLATSHSMLSAVPVPTQGTLRSTMRDSSKPISGEPTSGLEPLTPAHYE
jgi:hypothetical protein